jgi:hypothetical protein
MRTASRARRATVCSTPEEVVGLPADIIFKLFREHSLENVYDFEHDVRIGEALELRGKLPAGLHALPAAELAPGRVD